MSEFFTPDNIFGWIGKGADAYVGIEGAKLTIKERRDELRRKRAAQRQSSIVKPALQGVAMPQGQGFDLKGMVITNKYQLLAVVGLIGALVALRKKRKGKG